MGFFSWNTGDTNKSIMNTYTKKPTEVAVLWPCGERWITTYGGYGDFSGKDIYAEIAIRNNMAIPDGREARDIALEAMSNEQAIMSFEECAKNGMIVPKFAEDLKAMYEDVNFSTDARGQGYFYEDGEGNL